MIETVLTLFTVCFFARMSPGPDMMLIIKYATAGGRSASQTTSNLSAMESECGSGRAAAYACVLGVTLGLCVHVMLSVLGLAVLLKSHPLVFTTVQYAGALYLLYIGWRCVTDTGDVELCGQGTNAALFESFRDGLFCNLLNPKVTMFILSVFMQLVSAETAVTERLIYGSVIVLEGLIGWSVFVFFLHTPFMRKVYGKHVGVINKIAGVILFALGGAIFVMG